LIGAILTTVYSIVLLPFTFIYVIIYKMILFNKKRDRDSVLELLFFIVAGLFILLIAIVPDAVKYLRQVYETDSVKV